MQTINWKGHGAMFGANAIWGLMSPVAKFVMLGGIVTPLAVTDLRIVGAMILFWILSFFRKSEHVPPKDLAKLFGASLLGVVLNQGSFILGVGMTSPVNASIITTSMPLWAMILAAIFLKEPITAKGTRHRRRSLGSLAVGPRQRKYGQCRRALRRGRPAGPVRAVELRTLLRVIQEFRHPLLAHDHHEMDVHFRHALYPALHRPRPAFDRLAGPFRSSDRLPGIHRRRQHVSELHADHRRTKNLRPTVAGMYNYIQPLVATLVAVCWGMETFDPTKICSVLLIFSGVYLVTTSRSRADAEKSRLQPESPRKRQ